MFSIGGGFHVYAPDAKPIAEVKGNWKAKDFQMLTPEQAEQLAERTAHQLEAVGAP